MEFLIFLGIIFGIPFLINLFSSDNSNSTPSTPSSGARLNAGRFEVRAQVGERTNSSGQSFNVVNISIRGAVKVPIAGVQSVVVCDMEDRTGEKPLPIIAMVKELQASDLPVFHYVKEGPKIPYENTVISDWADLLAFPIDVLCFPRSGRRKLRVSLKLHTGGTGVQIASASADVRVNVREEGYEEGFEKRRKVKELTARLAMAVSGADGSFDRAESDFIKDWVKGWTTNPEGERDEELLACLNNAIRRAYRDMSEGDGIQLPQLCKELKSTASKGECYDALELCVKLAGSDGTADRSEMQALNLIASALDVDTDVMRGFIDKHLPVSIHSHKDVRQLLGLREDMTVHEKKTLLRKAYRHWNSMIAHSNAKKREQANEMLILISEERAKLKNY